jgi:hypothetical protein
MRIIGWGLVLGMAALGVAAAAKPQAVSVVYGVPKGGMTGMTGNTWVRAAGMRDLGLAGILGSALARGDDPAAAAAMIATGAIAVTDLGNVVKVRGMMPAWPVAIHISGILGGLIGGARLARKFAL